MKSEFKPVTAVTMGDPAGIGPEIVVGTMLDKELYDSCLLYTSSGMLQQELQCSLEGILLL